MLMLCDLGARSNPTRDENLNLIHESGRQSVTATTTPASYPNVRYIEGHVAHIITRRELQILKFSTSTLLLLFAYHPRKGRGLDLDREGDLRCRTKSSSESESYLVLLLYGRRWRRRWPR